jgi:hypothetical protein
MVCTTFPENVGTSNLSMASRTPQKESPVPNQSQISDAVSRKEFGLTPIEKQTI